MDGPFIWYKNFGSRLFCSVTMHAFDRQKDGRTDRKATEIPCVCIRSRTIKMNQMLLFLNVLYVAVYCRLLNFCVIIFYILFGGV